MPSVRRPWLDSRLVKSAAANTPHKKCCWNSNMPPTWWHSLSGVDLCADDFCPQTTAVCLMKCAGGKEKCIEYIGTNIRLLFFYVLQVTKIYVGKQWKRKLKHADDGILYKNESKFCSNGFTDFGLTKKKITRDVFWIELHCEPEAN